MVGKTMIENEEPKKQDWRNYLRGGFAYMDAPFAVHPLDEARARKMFFAAMRENVTIDDIKKAAQEYLEKRSWNPDAIPTQIKRVERFVKSIKPTKKKKSAWLIRWETIGEPLSYDDQIIAIRDGRISSEKIKEYVEQYYMSTHYEIAEKMHYASHQKDNPYPAEYATHPSGGIWTARITCGDNPFICASFVKNLKAYSDDEDGMILSWDKVKPI